MGSYGRVLAEAMSRNDLQLLFTLYEIGLCTKGSSEVVVQVLSSYWKGNPFGIKNVEEFVAELDYADLRTELIECFREADFSPLSARIKSFPRLKPIAYRVIQSLKKVASRKVGAYRPQYAWQDCLETRFAKFIFSCLPLENPSDSFEPLKDTLESMYIAYHEEVIWEEDDSTGWCIFTERLDVDLVYRAVARAIPKK